MFENVQFFRICILRFQKVLLLKNINMGIKKRRCLCWFQIRCCRLKQMPIKKLEPKNYAKFEYLFSCLCIFSWFFASDLCGLMISEMTLSNQSHFPRFFQSPEDDLPGPDQFRLTTSRNRLSPEDGFRQLVSSDHLFRFTRMTFRQH